MSRDLNKVFIIGRLAKDPDLRYTEHGSAVVSFTVASGRTWKTPDGETKDETEWVRVVAWSKLAEICGKFLVKGSKVFIEGRMQTRKWLDREGAEHYTTEVVANDMIMLDSKGRDTAAMQQETEEAEVAVNEDDIPF